MFHFFKKKEKTKLPFITDVHCHILPGVDHGAYNIDNGLELLRAETDMGISRFVLTPHVTRSSFENTPETINEAFSHFKKAVEAENPDIKLMVSAEYRVDEFSLAQFNENRFLFMPGNHILIENAYQQERIDLDDIISNLQSRDIIPIMAHPERFVYYASNRSRLLYLHNVGVRFQVNLLTFAGHYGKATRQCADWLLQHNLIDFLGTDIHHIGHVEIINKYRESHDFRKTMQQLAPALLNDQL